MTHFHLNIMQACDLDLWPFSPEICSVSYSAGLMKHYHSTSVIVCKDCCASTKNVLAYLLTYLAYQFWVAGVFLSWFKVAHGIDRETHGQEEMYKKALYRQGRTYKHICSQDGRCDMWTSQKFADDTVALWLVYRRRLFRGMHKLKIDEWHCGTLTSSLAGRQSYFARTTEDNCA